MCLHTPWCVHPVCHSGDDRVGLIGQQLLSFIYCINPCRFNKVQTGVLHQCLGWKVRVKAGGSESSSVHIALQMDLNEGKKAHLHANKVFKWLETISDPQLQTDSKPTLLQHYRIFTGKAFYSWYLAEYSLKDAQKVSVLVFSVTLINT